MNDSGIAIIVPTYNRATLLPDCLDSILTQMQPADRLIVVDDGSADDTQAVLARYEHRVAPMKIENSGKAAALNIALERADLEFVWIVDDDDVIAPTARQDLMQVFAADPEADIAYGRHLRFHADPQSGERVLDETGHWTHCEPERFLVATLEDMFVHQPGMIVRRGLYDKVGPFDTELNRSVDYDMLIRLALAGRAVASDTVVFYQRQHDGIRGSEAQPVDAGDREDVWQSYDFDIFNRLYEELPLACYLPSRRIDGPADLRAALIQRGVVMARKNLWDQAIADFEQALNESTEPLGPQTREVARKMFSSKYGCDQLLNDEPVVADVAKLARRSPAGRQLARAIARGMYWRIREAAQQLRFGKAARYSAAAAALELASARQAAATQTEPLARQAEEA
ncbi:glycosyltransferase [Croceicoccus sp. F390]|uniref:Glycosyltransferase n=1 Tax=Croceicoccus esteveae TaxID=3075597 RepID=A0ABU2ZGR7_9SPHN|nr:glycosyltransferase [Croceicoccus sp. F390]MDT0575785.1 glycosyltransferase [Croceicoccus sp. F390]